MLRASGFWDESLGQTGALKGLKLGAEGLGLRRTIPQWTPWRYYTRFFIVFHTRITIVDSAVLGSRFQI